jgi:DNA (cytosine-5)-methyltransferase 1
MIKNYIKDINRFLKPTEFKYVALDLFAGCGGLSLGFESAGFYTIGYEMEASAVATYNKNLKGVCYTEKLFPGFEYPDFKYDVVIGGPPCQPFSVGGYQNGINDSRNGFPIFVDAIKRIMPSIWMFENVRGMLYSNKEYFHSIISELEDLGYNISYKLVNAVDYGVPQNRERVIVVGHNGNFSFPQKHASKTTTGQAIGDLIETIKDESKILTKSMDDYILKYEIASKCVNPRDLYLDRPSRTLTCRNIAASTGDMMRVKLKDGRRRRISVREAARLQSFPDWFEFEGNETQRYNQIGNAVPPLLSFQVAKEIASYLEAYGEDETVNDFSVKVSSHG